MEKIDEKMEINMTYKELLEELNAIDPNRLNDTVTIYEPYEDEYIPVVHSFISDARECDVLDDGHYVLLLKGEKNKLLTRTLI